MRGCSSEVTHPQSPGLLTRQRGQSLPVQVHCARALSTALWAYGRRVHSILAPYPTFSGAGSSAEAGLFFDGLAEPNRLSQVGEDLGRLPSFWKGNGANFL